MNTSTPVSSGFKSTDITDADVEELALAVQEILKQKSGIGHITIVLMERMPEHAEPAFVVQLASVFMHLSRQISRLGEHEMEEMVAKITSNDNMRSCLLQEHGIDANLLSLGPQDHGMFIADSTPRFPNQGACQCHRYRLQRGRYQLHHNNKSMVITATRPCIQRYVYSKSLFSLLSPLTV